MSEPTLPPRRPLATFLRKADSERAGAVDVPEDSALPLHDDPGDDRAIDAPLQGDTYADVSVEAAPRDEAPAAHVEDADRDPAPGADDAAVPAAPEVLAAFAAAAAAGPVDAAPASPRPGSGAPSFLRGPAGTRLHAPRWQWGVAAGLGALLLLQIAVADRARLAADAGSRPWIAALCGVLRCSLPAWREPAAFSMISRDVRPVPGQAGALQVQASIRNDARWAQAWPSLRLSLSDADGRVIGTGVFAPADYLGGAQATAGTLDPGQSAQIAFRVREPAASTVAFTFEFL